MGSAPLSARPTTMEPAYTFTLPSIHDDIALSVRLYHPRNLSHVIPDSGEPRFALKGAVIAHPYAPFGGCQDDHIVLAVTHCLLKQGYIVVTFDFRGAGNSTGKTSWTGSPEVGDYTSAIGLLVYYLHNLSIPLAPDALSPLVSRSSGAADSRETSSQELEPPSQRLQVVLAGYSYGSLILARLPHMSHIIKTFESAEKGTSVSEIYLRARTLARRTRQSLLEPQPPSTPRGRRLNSESSPRLRPRTSQVTVGGEEIDPSDRRRSQDSRRSFDAVREVPQRIKARMHRRNSSGTLTKQTESDVVESSNDAGPKVSVSYLMISPVLFPMTTTLLSPGLAFPTAKAGNAGSGFLSMEYSSMVLFGSLDHFTSAKKLKQWVERLSTASSGSLQWECFQGVDHFWRGDGVLDEVQARIKTWTSSFTEHSLQT
ncbi:prolyl oligopeptidase like protein [Zymoseptoria brevis]|uniref:Prolyl oligopeptidase like protein n=1 Tax=Zymoseptoria brevis TaxID=1047168 RepID=A0A0F4GAV6_9PEZI|nr:prolyl oligopeptidase like protein [Zymoseptoria brevis]